jgi:hypothetical protein
LGEDMAVQPSGEEGMHYNGPETGQALKSTG